MSQQIKNFMGKLKSDRKILVFSILAVLLVAAIPTAIIISTSKKDAGVTEVPKEPQNLAANESNSQLSNNNSSAADQKTTDTNAPEAAVEPKTAEKTDQQTNSTGTKSATTTNANTNSNTNTATTTPEPEPTSFTYGNTSGNLTNGGSVVSDGQYVYYSNSSDGYKLYRSKPDGTSKSKVSDTVCSSLNIVGDWIYYVDGMGSRSIYKIKKDGSGKTKVTSSQVNSGIAVVNNWIYYLERGASELPESALYKIKTDGSGKTKISFGTNNSFICNQPQDIVVIEGWVYLTLINKADNSYQLSRVKTDGSIVQKVSNSTPRFFSIADGWIYYADSTYKKIIKAKVDGSSQTAIYTIPDANYRLYSINVSNGYVYFSNDTESQPKDRLGIYKIKTDGSGVTQLVNGSARFLNISSDWIYFEAPGSSSPTYSNGSFKVTIGGSSQTLKLKIDGSRLLQVD